MWLPDISATTNGRCSCPIECWPTWKLLSKLTHRAYGHRAASQGDRQQQDGFELHRITLNHRQRRFRRFTQSLLLPAEVEPFLCDLAQLDQLDAEAVLLLLVLLDEPVFETEAETEAEAVTA